MVLSIVTAVLWLICVLVSWADSGRSWLFSLSVVNLILQIGVIAQARQR